MCMISTGIAFLPNGVLNENAFRRKAMAEEDILAAPMLNYPLTQYMFCSPDEGAAAVVLCRAENAHKYTDKPIYIKALSLVAGNCSGNADPNYDYTTFPEIAATGRDAYAQAGVTNPREQIAMAEVHDCFTPAELLIYEDLQFAERGSAWKEVLAGTFDLKGDMPVNPDGGLKSFGHPVGASGLRMMFEAWLQLRKEAPEARTIGNDRKLALTHNLGGYPGEMVSFVSILGRELG